MTQGFADFVKQRQTAPSDSQSGFANFVAKKNQIVKQPTVEQPMGIWESIKGFGKQLAKDIVSPVTRSGVNLYGIAKSTPSIIRGISARARGDIQGEREAVQKGMAELRPRNLPFFGEVKPVENLQEAAGEGVKAGLTAISFGSGSVASNMARQGLGRLSVGTLSKFPRLLPMAEKAITYGKGLLPRAIEQGVLGTGFTAGQALSENRTPTKEELASGFGFGSLLPVAGTGVAGVKEKFTGAFPNIAARINNSLIKPLMKDMSYGKNPGRGVANEGITFKTLEEGEQKIRTAWQNIGKQIGSAIAGAKQRVVDFSRALDPIDRAMTEAKKLPRTNAGLITRLEDLKKDLLKITTDMEGNEIIGRDLSKMSLDDIFQFKQDVADVTKFTGNASDDNVVNKTLKGIYGNSKGELNKWVPGLRGPGGLNERYADLRSADIAIKYRDKIEQRQNLIKITPKMLTGGGAIASAFTLNPLPFLISLGAAGIEKMISTPIFKTTVAKWMAKASQEEKQSFLRAVPGVQNIMSRIFGEKAPLLPYSEAPAVGLSIKNVSKDNKFLPKQIDSLTKDEMISVIDYIRSGAKTLNPKMEQAIESLATKFGFKPSNYTKIANALEDLVDKTKTKDVSGRVVIPEFKGFEDLSTKIVEKLKGRTSVSKQFISDLTNSPDLKQPERDLIRRVLEGESDNISVKDFANKVKTELLPLKRETQTSTRYEGTTLPEELRGPIAKYEEHIYNSPISVSEDPVHFPGKTGKMFGWTRTEDLVDGQTRRVVEVQNFLYQKGNIENEFPFRNFDEALAEARSRGGVEPPAGKSRVQWEKEAQDLAKTWMKETEEVKKLLGYDNPTAHFRKIREEVKQAAKDGKTKLQFPTGETAMKIEGLGFENKWEFKDSAGRFGFSQLTPEKMSVGKEVLTNGGRDSWIITDVLGDGKFKALPKSAWEDHENFYEAGKMTIKEALDNLTPTGERLIEPFDISGKVDTNNPIYRFYEKEVGRYVTNKYAAKQITDPQGVKWLEVPIKKEMGRLPIEAFGLAGFLLPKKEKENVSP